MSRTPSLRPAVIALAALVLLVLHGSTARADLQFSQTSVKVGEVKCGAPLVHDFAFTNAGNETIEIAEIQASCGCLKPKLEPRIYKAGESGKLHIEVNTLTQAAGPHAWLVHVHYRLGEEMREQALQLTGNLSAEITVQPSALTVFADHGVSHDVLVTDLRPNPFTITAVRATSPKLTPRVTEETRDALDHRVRKIRLDVAEDFPEGRHEEMLDIYTDDPTYRDLKVPVTIVKRSRKRFTALPATVALSAPPGRPIPSKIVLIRDKDNEAVEIGRITTSDPAIACTWARGPNTMATLRITVDRSRVQGDSLNGSVEVQLSKPAAETVTIPVTVQ